MAPFEPLLLFTEPALYEFLFYDRTNKMNTQRTERSNLLTLTKCIWNGELLLISLYYHKLVSRDTVSVDTVQGMVKMFLFLLPPPASL